MKKFLIFLSFCRSLPSGWQCLCFACQGRRLIPSRRFSWRRNSCPALGEQMAMGPSFLSHVCVCWALRRTWRTYGRKTMLTTTWISTPSDTSWGLSTACVSWCRLFFFYLHLLLLIRWPYTGGAQWLNTSLQFDSPKSFLLTKIVKEK